MQQAESALLASRSGGDHESNELDFLARTGEDVKVRDGHMDIRVLREVNAVRLEQWAPVMKTGFPVLAAEATKASRHSA